MWAAFTEVLNREGGATAASAQQAIETANAIRLEPDRHLAQTNQQGQFEIRKFYPGEYTLYASHTGVAAFEQVITIGGQSPAPVNIRLKKSHH